MTVVSPFALCLTNGMPNALQAALSGRTLEVGCRLLPLSSHLRQSPPVPIRISVPLAPQGRGPKNLPTPRQTRQVQHCCTAHQPRAHQTSPVTPVAIQRFFGADLFRLCEDASPMSAKISAVRWSPLSS